MTLRFHNLRLEVAAVQQQLLHFFTFSVLPCGFTPSNSFFTFSVLPCGFTSTDAFVLRQLLNRDRMNKLSQLSVSVCFTLQVTCLDPFPYMLSKVSIQSIGHASHVLRLA
jgi:hypothetical protein